MFPQYVDVSTNTKNVLHYIDPWIQVKVRLSTTGLDVRLLLNTAETIGMAKRKLQEQEGCQEPRWQRWYFGGKLLGQCHQNIMIIRVIMIITSFNDESCFSVIRIS